MLRCFERLQAYRASTIYSFYFSNASYIEFHEVVSIRDYNTMFIYIGSRYKHEMIISSPQFLPVWYQHQFVRAPSGADSLRQYNIAICTGDGFQFAGNKGNPPFYMKVITLFSFFSKG